MAEYARGIKAGVVAGIIAGIVNASGQVFLFQFYTSDIRNAIQSTALPAGVTVDQAVAFTLYTTIAVLFMASIVIGAILGLIFAPVVNKYMKNSSFSMRGITFGVVLWVIGILGDLGGLNTYGATYFAGSIVIGFVADVLAFGYLLGHFYGRFGPKQTMAPTPASPSGTMP